jgi:hypothetical protein
LLGLDSRGRLSLRERGGVTEKGAGVIRTLFLFYISIISIRADYPDTISDFIFFADSSG